MAYQKVRDYLDPAYVQSLMASKPTGAMDPFDMPLDQYVSEYQKSRANVNTPGYFNNMSSDQIGAYNWFGSPGAGLGLPTDANNLWSLPGEGEGWQSEYQKSLLPSSGSPLQTLTAQPATTSTNPNVGSGGDGLAPPTRTTGSPLQNYATEPHLVSSPNPGSPTNSAQSTEANTAIQTGGNLTTTPPTSATTAASSGAVQRWTSPTATPGGPPAGTPQGPGVVPSTTGGSTTPAGPSPGAGTAANGGTPSNPIQPGGGQPAGPSASGGSAPKAQINFSNPDGTPMSEAMQATNLAKWLRTMGVSVGPIAVGGTSPYDEDINQMIARINSPQTTDAERRILANDLNGLIQLRNKSVQEPSFIYGGRTSGDIISGLDKPGGTNGRLMDWIAQMQDGGAGDDEARRIATSRLVSDVGGRTTAAQQEAANRLGASGVSGGFAQDRLNDIGIAGDQSRAQGLADIELGLLDKQQQSKQSALSALLQASGQEQQARTDQANLAAQQENAQNLLGFQGDQAATEADLQKRQQDIQLLLSLLSQAQNGDQDAAARALQLLQLLGGE